METPGVEERRNFRFANPIESERIIATPTHREIRSELYSEFREDDCNSSTQSLDESTRNNPLLSEEERVESGIAPAQGRSTLSRSRKSHFSLRTGLGEGSFLQRSIALPSCSRHENAFSRTSESFKFKTTDIFSWSSFRSSSTDATFDASSLFAFSSETHYSVHPPKRRMNYEKRNADQRTPAGGKPNCHR